MERENKKERSFTFLSYLIGIRRGRRGNARFFFLFEGKDGILLDEGVDYDEGGTNSWSSPRLTEQTGDGSSDRKTGKHICRPAAARYQANRQHQNALADSDNSDLRCAYGR